MPSGRHVQPAKQGEHRALAGWLLEWSGFDGKLAVQPDFCISMLHFMYLWLPFIIDVVIMLVLAGMRVEKANERLRAE